MNWQRQQLLICFVVSLAVHVAILGCAWIVANPALLTETSADIYDAGDLSGTYLPEPDEAIHEKVERVARRYVSRIELVVLKQDMLDKLFGRTNIIARQVDDQRARDARKTLPVMKNPAVKPKLVKHSKIPYPAEAGGETGSVVVCFLVGYDGRPEYTSTAESSGNRFLDAAAVDGCIDWRFTPARDAKGRLVRCLVYIPVQVEP